MGKALLRDGGVHLRLPPEQGLHIGKRRLLSESQDVPDVEEILVSLCHVLLDAGVQEELAVPADLSDLGVLLFQYHLGGVVFTCGGDGHIEVGHSGNQVIGALSGSHEGLGLKNFLRRDGGEHLQLLAGVAP